MLRSMVIGLAIASLLQFGAENFAPANTVSLAAQRIDWVTLQAQAVDHLVCQGYRVLSR
jgi:hypothetical protein